MNKEERAAGRIISGLSFRNNLGGKIILRGEIYLNLSRNYYFVLSHALESGGGKSV